MRPKIENETKRNQETEEREARGIRPGGQVTAEATDAVRRGLGAIFTHVVVLSPRRWRWIVAYT